MENKKVQLNGKEKVQEYLKGCRPDAVIYPSRIKRLTKLDTKTVYQILDGFVEEGLIKRIYQAYCPECQRSTGRNFESLSEIPSRIKCEYCGVEIGSPIDASIVLYQKK